MRGARAFTATAMAMAPLRSLVFCKHSELPVAHVTVPAVVSSAPAAASSVAHVAPPRRPSPFAFVRGTAQAMLGDYATHYWGAGGASVFSSAATNHSADVAAGPGDELLMQVGQYAVVEVPERGGFFVRDFGERGWVTTLEARDMTGSAKKELVMRYSMRDDQEVASEDWARWQKSPVKFPEVHAVSHMVIEVWSFAASSSGEPTLLFAHEFQGWALCCGSEVGPAPPHVDDDVEMKRGEITVRVREAWRTNRASWKETPLPDVPEVLGPWSGIKERTFRFDASQRAFVELP